MLLVWGAGESMGGNAIFGGHFRDESAIFTYAISKGIPA
jgi:hypothetical protein